MSNKALKVENLYKQYRLGVIGSGTLRDDLARWWAKLRRKEDPTAQLGAHNQLDVVDQQYVWALQDINFEVNQGQVLGIIGKNGAGKSTLLKLLSKVTSPTKGNIKVKGRIASLLEVGTGFHPELTGRENIYLNGAILGMHRHEIKAKFDEIVEFAGVAKYVDTPVKRYSSGMYVRLAFAVAAHLEPEILVVDEVLAVGDAEFQKKAIGKMKDVSVGQGRTVLFVSHNMASIRQLCDSCIFMEKGMVKFQGDVNKAIDMYLSQITEGAQGTHITLKEDESKSFQLIEASVSSTQAVQLEAFECSHPLKINLKFRVRETVPGLYGYLALFKQDGTQVFESDSFDSPPNQLDGLPPGIHDFVINIPENILGVGTYTVYLNFTSPLHTGGFNVDSPKYILKFQLSDNQTKRGNNRNGFFSTLLKWDKQ